MAIAAAMVAVAAPSSTASVQWSKSMARRCPKPMWSGRRECGAIVRFVVVSAAANDEGMGSAAGASSDSVVGEVAVLEEPKPTPAPTANGGAAPKRKPSPLERGGTLSGDAAEGKDPSPATLGKSKLPSALNGKFEDPRWKNGTWDLPQFVRDGKMEWDDVIDAEVLRRKWLEQHPQTSSNEDPVLFDTAKIPWWAWVKRFHLPQAELLNGRAAMLGFFAAYLVDSATGIGLVDQTSSFFGKLFLFVTVVGVMIIRKTEDINTLKTLVKESTFYDKQWQATWKEDEDDAKLKSSDTTTPK